VSRDHDSSGMIEALGQRRWTFEKHSRRNSSRLVMEAMMALSHLKGSAALVLGCMDGCMDDTLRCMSCYFAVFTCCSCTWRG
jgi:hypothetical protein